MAILTPAEPLRDALMGVSKRDVLAALAHTSRDHSVGHPGRYTETVGARFAGADHKLVATSSRVIETITAVVVSHGIPEPATVHAIRTIPCCLHGSAMPQACDAFRWTGDTYEGPE